MRKYAIMAMIIGAVTVLLYWPTRDSVPAPESIHRSADSEMRAKQSLVERDLAHTNMMCRTQCKHDLTMLADMISMSITEESKPEDIHTLAHDFIARHPHIPFIKIMRTHEAPIHIGSFSAVISELYREQEQEGIDSAARGQLYQSPELQNEQGIPYFITAIPLHEQQGVLIGATYQQLLNDVQIHQRKNLRIVPYPSDKRFRIKSVDANDWKDVQVNHPEQNEGTSHYHTGQIVVKFRKLPSAKELAQIQTELDVVNFQKLDHTYVFKSKSKSTNDMMRYFKQWNIEYAEPHFLYMTNMNGTTSDAFGNTAFNSWNPGQTASATFIPNDALFEPYQWNLLNIQLLHGWRFSKGSPDVKVAVIDTGVDLTHPDLVGQLTEGFNALDHQRSAADDVGHGTHVAGIIAAITNNREGVAGMNWYSQVMPVKVLDETGAGNTYAVAEGIIWATDHGAKVINLSLGNYADAEFLHDAVKYAYHRDVVIVAATGNDNTSEPGYPAAYPEVLAVSATDENNNMAVFSNYGDYVDVMAPGQSIASTYMGHQYAALSGTSMASPHVSALAALIRAVNPGLKNTEVIDIIRRTASDLGRKGKDPYYGYGLIDANLALERAIHPEQVTASFWKKLWQHF